MSLNFYLKVFASGKTDYAGQAAGIIIAESFDIALEAMKKVKINYGTSHPVMFDVRQIVKDNVTSRIKEIARIEPTAKKGICYVIRMYIVQNAVVQTDRTDP